MKKYLLIGVVGLLLLTGCGSSKSADIVCSGEMTEGGQKIAVKYYAYLTDGKISKLDAEMTFDNEDTAKQMCGLYELAKSMAPEESKDMNVKCSGKTMTIENFPDDNEGDEKVIGSTKEAFVAMAEKEGMTCK